VHRGMSTRGGITQSPYPAANREKGRSPRSRTGDEVPFDLHVSLHPSGHDAIILLDGPNHPFGGCYSRDRDANIYSSVLLVLRRRQVIVRKFMILGALVAVVVAALAIPALAQHNDFSWANPNDDFAAADQFAIGNQEDRLEAREDRWEERQDRWEERADEGFFGANNNFERFADFSGFDAQNWWDDNDWDDDAWREDDDRNDAGSGISQSSEQNASSGNVNQSFNVSGGGDNSNQCVGLQGVANTGNAQNQVSVLQYGSQADEFSFEDSGASINVSPTNATRCDQQVNQAASAFGGR
jgi:hypothetical protein